MGAWARDLETRVRPLVRGEEEAGGQGVVTKPLVTLVNED